MSSDFDDFDMSSGIKREDDDPPFYCAVYLNRTLSSPIKNSASVPGPT